MITKNFLFILMFTLSTEAAESVAFIKSVQGDVILKRDNTTRSVLKGENIFQHDVIQTGKGGGAGLSFNDGTRISVGSQSNLEIDDYLFEPSKKAFRFDLSLHKGIAVFESGRIGKLAPEKVNFKVPQGVVGIRGTKFVVEVE
jgi:hypothetical protein